MPPRPTLPADDLYARLGVPDDASPEAIELAWRGLLRKHHPDVAGPEGLELAKRINVAHDWLSDAGLRRRYDLERHGDSSYVARSSRAGPRRETPGRASDGTGTARRPYRPPTTAEQVALVIDRVGRLTRDELDRLALAEPAPIAFLATLRRFATADLQVVLAEAERAALARLPTTARRRPAIRDAVVGRLAEIVLGTALDELLGESGGQRARERLSRGWDAAVGQPRYGPATRAVDTYLERLGQRRPDDLRLLSTTGSRDVLGEHPWPAGISPDEDEALRVSSALASADAVSALDGEVSPAARRAAARIAHLLVLRPTIPPAAFDRLAAAWSPSLIPHAGPWTTRVRPRR